MTAPRGWSDVIKNASSTVTSSSSVKKFSLQNQRSMYICIGNIMTEIALWQHRKSTRHMKDFFF